MTATFFSRIPHEVDLERYLQSPLLWRDYENRTATLTEGMSRVLTSFDTAQYLMDIQLEYALSDDQTSELARVIRDILLSKLYIGDLGSIIASQVGIDDTTARQIANRLVSELFQPIMADIKTAQMKHFRDRIAQQQVPGQPTGAQPSAPRPPQTPNTLDLREENKQP